MAQYIEKSALLAEIDERIKVLQRHPHENHKTICHLDNLKQNLNTLEVKEVDLSKEIDNEWSQCEPIDEGMGLEIASIEHEQFDKIAKHFFELGLKASNPITAADRGTAEEIIINLKRVEKDYRIDLTREIEWVRNKVKKGK